jgi:hypothetical protein
MGDVFLTAGMGLFFIFLGRWVCKYPNKVYPEWVPSDPEKTFFKNHVRTFGRFCIFVGVFLLAERVVASIFPVMVAMLVGLIAGVVGAWRLRPQINQ